MSDPIMTIAWLSVLGAGLGGALLVRSLGLASTYVRDLLHVGAGVWILGWPLWHGLAAPMAIVGLAVIATAAVPPLAPHLRLAARIQRSVAEGDERWAGLVLYTGSYAIFTLIGLTHGAFPAAAALLALSLGDGLGGAVGRSVGRHRFAAPGGKVKTLEGSLTVFAAATLGAHLAARLFHAPASALDLVVIGAVAAVVEASSPRGTDNTLVPMAVWPVAALLVGS